MTVTSHADLGHDRLIAIDRLKAMLGGDFRDEPLARDSQERGLHCV